MPDNANTPPKLINGLAAGLTAGCVTAIAMGGADGIWALSSAENTLEQTSAALFCLFSMGLLAPVTVLMGFALGVLVGGLPVDVGPRGAWRALRTMWQASGATAGRISGAIWAGAGGVLVTFAAMFFVNRLFMVTFHNQTLSSLLLAAVTLVLVGAAVGLTIWAALGLGRALAARPGFLSSPRLPVVLAVTVGTAALVIAPMRFEEIWKALDLRAPVAGLAMVAGLWAMTGLGATAMPQRPGRSALVGLVVLVVALAGLAAPAVALFDEDRTGAAALMEGEGLLAKIPLKVGQRLMDADKDGFAGHFGGGDCDDAAKDISPGADDLPDNGIDEDCDGSDLMLKDPDGEAPKQVAAPEKPAEVDKLGAARKRYNIVWILADTLRWDRTGWGGYERPTTPATDKIAARSTVFENGYSLSSMTPMVIGPMMAGRYPSELPRVYTHFVEYGDEGNTFIAERLRDAGYLTAGSTSHWYLKRYSGLAQGFSRWHTVTTSRAKMYDMSTSKPITDKAIEMLGHLSEGRLPPKGPQDEGQPDKAVGEKPPWFLYLHYIDPHANYIHHDSEGFKRFGNSFQDRYDGEVRFMDHHLGRLFEALEAVDPGLKSTIIVFTSDHGEGMGHKDIWMHGTNLFEPLIRAAYFIYFPGAKPQRIKARASLIDIVPTLLDAVGMETPADIRGLSLLPQLVLHKPFVVRPIYTEMPPGPQTSHRRSLIVGDMKLIHKIKGNTWTLYDLSADPDEGKNLWFDRKDEAKRMKEAYLRFRATQIERVEATR